MDILDMIEVSVATRSGKGFWGRHPKGERVNEDGRNGKFPTVRMSPEAALKLLRSMSQADVAEEFGEVVQ